MEEDKDPFSDDDNGLVRSSRVETENKELCGLPGSPILNTPNCGLRFNNVTHRREGFWASRSDSLPRSNQPHKADENQEDDRLPPPSPHGSLVGALQSVFPVPKTPANQILPRDSPVRYASDSDEDIFSSASPTHSQEVIPSALNALIDGPEQGDMSWTSSMVTPSGNNATWHNLNAEDNLNTEERKVLLPSADSNFTVKPRALFTPGFNDTADSHSLNISSDIDCFQFSKGERSEKTPNYKGRRNSCGFKIIESPLSTVRDASPTHKVDGEFNRISNGSPILSGSSEFKRSPNQSEGPPEEEEDMFDNEEPPITTQESEQSSKKKRCSVAESTPNIARKQKSSLSEEKDLFAPPESELCHAESFLGDISVSTLEAVCKAHESKAVDTLASGTPEKQTESMRKRLLFTSNMVVANPDRGVFKMPEDKFKDTKTSSNQENVTDNCIPDDSFMEHLAAMNTSIFSDPLQPVSKMRSIKTSVSHMKTFCYSVDKKSDHVPVNESNSVESQTLKKEILSSVLTLESSSNANIKTKSIKSSGDLIVFSQLQEKINQMQPSEDELFKSSVTENVFGSARFSGSLQDEGNDTSNSRKIELQSLLSTSDGFQTARGDHIKLSQEAISKGLSILKGAMDEKDVPLDDNKEIILPTKDFQPEKRTSPTVLSNDGEVKLEIDAGVLNDSQDAEELKQLLHGVDFNQWHEIEEPSDYGSATTSEVSNIKGRSSPQGSSKNFQHTSEIDLLSPPSGFATASGKNISVSEKNMARAKLLLKESEEGVDDLINGETVRSKLKSECSNSIIDVAAVRDNRPVKSKDVTYETAAKTFHQTDRKRRFSAAPNNGGFINPKKVCLEHDLSNSNSQSNTTHPIVDNLEEKLGNYTDSKCKIGDEEKAVTACCSTDGLLGVPSERNQAGNFLTASGMSINISKQALDRARDLFNDDFPDVSSTAFEKKDILQSLDKIHRNNPNKDAVLFASSSSKVHSPNGSMQPQSDFYKEGSTPYFTAASGKIVNVSKEALNKAKNLFDDIPDALEESWEKLEISEKMISDAESLALQADKVVGFVEPHPSSCEQKPVGFSTASGKHVAVSKEAFDKVKNIFNDIPKDDEFGHDDNKSNATLESVGFLTANGKKVDISEEALNKAKGLLDNIPSELGSASSPFNNKLMTPKKIIGSKQNRQTPNQAFSSSKVTSHFDDFSNGLALPELFKEFQEEEYNSSSKGGFSTASGKSVTISKEALNKVKNLFNELASDSQNNAAMSPETSKCTNDVGPFNNKTLSEGFSTASGKTVHVSEEALQKVKGLFDADDFASGPSLERKDDFEKDRVNMKGSSIQMVGFQTAGGKGVQISRDSLKKAQKLFDESSTESQSAFKEDLSSIKYEKFLGEGVSKSANPTIASIPMQGFSTAGGRAVLISETALQKAKNLFEELPSDSASTDVGQSHNFSISEGKLKTKVITEDDSGVFTSNTLNESSMYETSKPSVVPMHRLSNVSRPYNANKENQRMCSKSNLDQSETFEMQKSSLTQEITASTAAFLADCESIDQVESGSTVSKLMETISTSPSMATDRLSSLRPVLSSSSENKAEAAEPTSPILVNNKSFGQRRRSRRGRLSLSSNTSIKSGSPTFGSQASSNLSSHSSLRKPRLSLPARSNLSSPPTKSLTIDKESGTGEQISVQSGDSCSSSNFSVNHPPSRKLFTDEPTLSSAMHSGSACKAREITSPIKESKPVSIKSDDPPTMRHSHQTPLMRKVLTRNSGPQTSGFKTPYKSPSKEQLKRQPSSPAQNPPEAKRRKPSTNLYVSHIYSNSSGSVKISGRELRPEVAEMRRRAAEEQKQLVANHADEKGELLKPCVGSWLAGKLQGEESHKRTIKLSEIGQPLMHPSRKLINIGLNASTVTVTAANAAEFRFSAWDHYSEDVCRENVAGLPVGDGALLVLDSQGTAGVEEIERSFFASPGVDPSLVPSGWVKNHYRWLVWKLASVESRFPHHFKKRCLSPHVLMLQLKYRYDREVDRCERPALRRILEHDDSAAKRMVLCVAGIRNPRDSNQAGVGLELELTDGWYSVTASIDLDMQHRVRKGVIAVGTKLIMHGAELVNCSEGCSPLQVHPEVRIKLCSNSTRRARWHAKLGFQDNPGPMRMSLGSILSSGGVVSCVSVYIARVYPLVFMEKTQERTIIRSQRAESKEVSKSEKKIHQLAETVYSQVQAEIQKEQMIQKKSCIKFSLRNLPNVTSGEELFEVLESASDPLSVQSMLSREQKNSLEDYQRAKQEELSRELESRVRLQLSEKSKHERQVTPVLKVRLLNFDKQNCSAILSVWRPSDDLTSAFKEGQKMTIFGATANGLRCGDLQLSANRSTRYQADSSSDIKSDLLRTVLPLSALASPGIVPRFGELDIVGFVVKVGPAPQTSENTSHFQTAYVCDGHQNIVGLSFWDGLKEFGVEDLITPSSFIAASNLQCRAGAIARAIPCVYASELSLFTTNPRQGYLQAAMRELRQSLPTDLKSFRIECEEKLDNLQLQRGSSPAVCPRTPDPTPLSNPAQPTSASVNAQDRTPTNAPGAAPVKTQRKLSMDHQFKTPSSLDNLSPAARLAKLEAYGEPPPISPILLSNPRRSLRTQFKAPRKTDSPSVDCMKLEKS